MSITLPDAAPFFWEAGLESEGRESEGKRDGERELNGSIFVKLEQTDTKGLLFNRCGAACKRSKRSRRRQVE